MFSDIVFLKNIKKKKKNKTKQNNFQFEKNFKKLYLVIPCCFYLMSVEIVVIQF